MHTTVLIVLLLVTCWIERFDMQTIAQVKYKYYSGVSMSQTFQIANYMNTSLTKTKVQCLALCNRNPNCRLVDMYSESTYLTCNLYSASSNWTNNQVANLTGVVFVKT